jgi:hypothetical protein
MTQGEGCEVLRIIFTGDDVAVRPVKLIPSDFVN